MASELIELRLPSFKSVKDASIPIRPLTLIVGRNGSGKSNILDGLAVLSALATGNDLRDALDGGRDGPIVRGGSEGCAPLGENSFSIGCTVDTGELELKLDLEVQTSPSLQITSERLWTIRTTGNRRGEPLDFLKTDLPTPYSADIVARWDNNKRGTNPPVTFRATQLLTSQVVARVPATTQAGRRVHEAAEQMLQAIMSIFILDPVPHQMREYVPEKDSRLRRYADNLSATLTRLLDTPDIREELLSMTASLSEAQVSELTSVASDLGDVMISVIERLGGRDQQVPARLMSDGTLRFLAIAAAMLDTPPTNTSGEDATRVLVLEELENGLHPSQASLLLERVKRSAALRKVRTIATTHSPAILDALSGDDHDSVIVASRDADGWSSITRLVDFPDYFEVVGKTALGTSATQDRLRPREIDPKKVQTTLDSIFGSKSA